ncbi:AfsR/SARP family transcriptional regulator [Kitasatospora viridis]|uniref:DNA-binding SARP family transcriptional activator n=1 Tax=Kitasatospora viridis TaxID=281105 RepID=A0A561UQ29_9ACTN|nr:AfsR/SARP family transcriptional regulator [Kitasatospora viridis]TWG01473.1 DNA-binding SARP family transcriptional activator [Kitasatospora viridis]
MGTGKDETRFTAGGGAFALLGPLRVVDGGGEVLQVAAGRQRELLAALLLRANQIVPAEELTELLWPGGGERVRTTLRSYVMRLRRSLGGLGGRLETVAPGYRLTVDGAVTLDLGDFLGRCRAGRRAARQGDWPSAHAQLEAALALWRDEPLLDVPCEPLRERELPALAEARRQARELRCEALVECGRPADAVAELRELIREEALSEHAYAVLMQALARLDRRAEALDVFRELRAVLRDELGVEPGSTLQRLHRELLSAQDARRGPTGPPGGLSTTVQVPKTTPRVPTAPARTLPSGNTFFTGREAELERMLDLFAPERGSGPTGAAAQPVLVVVSGMGGTGKTSLAVQVARLTQGRFPGGQVYLNLRGSAGAGDPERAVGPDAHLGALLHRLGCTAAEVPGDPSDRLELLRTRLAEQRILLILDDVRDAAQLRSILPALACSVIVTSRKHLAGLPGAAHVALDGMDRAASRRLLARLVGAPRLAAEDEATEELMELCADLPLALRLAGARLATRPRWAVADLCGSIRSARSRLDQLSFGDESVRAAFEVAYLRLGRAELRQLFCLVGLAAGAELGLPAVAALTGRDPAEPEGDLEFLVDVCLLQSSAPARYGAHDLLRDYAAERSETDLPAEERTAALVRLLSWYAQAAISVTEVLRPTRVVGMVALDQVPDGLPAGPQFAEVTEAVAWMQTELPNVRAAIRLGAASTEPRLQRLCWQLARAIAVFLMIQRETATMIELLTVGADAAARLGDLEAEALQRADVAIALLQSGAFEQAVEVLERCVEVQLALGRPANADSARANLGIAFAELGRLDAAAAQFELVLAYREESGALGGQFEVWSNLARLRLMAGDLDASLAACEGAEAVAALADGVIPNWEAYLHVKATCLQAAGKPAQAAEAAEESARLRREQGDRQGLAQLLRLHGELLTELGHPRATAVLTEAAAVERELMAPVG